MNRYFVQEGNQPEREITKEEYIQAEVEAGFSAFTTSGIVSGDTRYRVQFERVVTPDPQEMRKQAELVIREAKRLMRTISPVMDPTDADTFVDLMINAAVLTMAADLEDSANAMREDH